MTKKEVINDMEFRKKCGKYGLDWEDYEICDEAILLYTPVKDLYVIFDRKYNTVSIDKLSSYYPPESIESFVRRKYNQYSNYVLGERNFCYPFEKFTLKQIMDLSNRTEIIETNQGQSLITEVNGQWYDCQSKEDEVYFQLLSYIKYLGEEIEKYFLTSYHFQTLGLEIPGVYEYVRSLINQVNNSINIFIEHNKRPWPSHILNSIGKNYRESNSYELLYDVVNLLINDKGFKIKSGSSDAIESIDNQNSKPDLSILSMQLLKILDTLDKESNKKEDEIEKGSSNIQIFELRP